MAISVDSTRRKDYAGGVKRLAAIFLALLVAAVLLALAASPQSNMGGSNPPLVATSAAFATATTAGTCVTQTVAVTNSTTSMAVVASPVSTPGVGAEWSASVTSAGTVTIIECAVATSAGGTIAFNVRVIP